MRHDWPAACEDFGCDEVFVGKHALIELYALTLERRKLNDTREQATQNQTAYGACLARLNEFAATHGKGDHTRYAAAADPAPAYPGAYEVY